MTIWVQLLWYPDRQLDKNAIVLHRNYLLVAFFEIPGYIFAMLIMDCWGRRPILSFCQTIAGAGCIAAGLLVGYEDLAWAQVS